MSQTSWIGKTIGGRYIITDLLGQGGMSAVYKASDPNLRRVVAIKLIHSHLSSDPQFVHRFKDEAAAVASLRHPNIVQVYDFNNDNSVYFIVFEFVPGESLQQYQTRVVNAGRVIPLSQTIEQGSNVADALAYAHGKGIVHRDIKSANVMLNVQNQAVLMDFGLVKLTGGTSHTAAGAVMGTARYMSPEQIRGERVDERTDIYSLGVMLYEMAAGRPPFQADSALSLMMMHVNEPVPSLQRIRSDVPASFVQAIEKALAKDREKRYQSAGEFATALRAIDSNSGAMVAGAAAAGTVPASAAAARKATAAKAAPVPARSTPQATYAAPIGTSQQPPIPHPGSQAQPSLPPSSGKSSSKRNIGILVGVAVLLMLILCIGGAAVVFGTGMLSGDDGDQDAEQGGAVAVNKETTADESTGDEGAATIDSTEIPVVATEIIPTEISESTPEPTIEPSATATDEPTAEPTTAAADEPTAAPTTPPTPTTPAGPNVTINDISVAGGQYEVYYAASGYTPSLPGGEHIHFFFDTVRPEDAGLPGPGPWLIYAGPVPFTLYSVGSRPAGANYMCALVANVDHSIQLGTGNCFALP